MYKIEIWKDNTTKIIETIEDWCSGDKISKKLNLSRTSVWKIISKLKSMGYVIEARKGKGYKLISKPEVSIYEIASILKKNNINLVREIYYFKEIDSTNEFAKKIGKANALIFAETQTAGKGRLGRRWFSDYGGLYFSITLKPNLSIENIPKITLTSGLAVCEALNELKLNARIKWPNDVLIDGKKVCGILCEIVGEINALLTIVGIGINVKNRIPKELEDKAVSISQIKETKLSDVFEKTIKKFDFYYNRLLEGEWDRIKKRWIEKSDTIGKKVLIKIGGKEYSGKALSIDEDGGLILDNGTKIFSGECFYN